MKEIKIENYMELESKRDLFKQESEYIINLSSCEAKRARRIIDFLAGLTFLNGNIVKVSSSKYKIEINN